MIARRIDPKIRSRFAGLHTLPSGRLVYCTHSAVLIGPRYVRPVRDPGVHAERLQSSLLWGRTRPAATHQQHVAAPAG